MFVGAHLRKSVADPHQAGNVYKTNRLGRVRTPPTHSRADGGYPRSFDVETHKDLSY